MGIGAFILLIVAALVLGFAAQMLATPRFSYDWVIAAVVRLTGPTTTTA